MQTLFTLEARKLTACAQVSFTHQACNRRRNLSGQSASRDVLKIFCTRSHADAVVRYPTSYEECKYESTVGFGTACASKTCKAPKGPKFLVEARTLTHAKNGALVPVLYLDSMSDTDAARMQHELHVRDLSTLPATQCKLIHTPCAQPIFLVLVSSSILHRE